MTIEPEEHSQKFDGPRNLEKLAIFEIVNTVNDIFVLKKIERSQDIKLLKGQILDIFQNQLARLIHSSYQLVIFTYDANVLQLVKQKVLLLYVNL